MHHLTTLLIWYVGWLTLLLYVTARAPNLWLSANPGKRWTEVFFLAYSPFWIVWALCILVPFQLYEVGMQCTTCIASGA